MGKYSFWLNVVIKPVVHFLYKHSMNFRIAVFVAQDNLDKGKES